MVKGILKETKKIVIKKRRSYFPWILHQRKHFIDLSTKLFNQKIFVFSKLYDFIVFLNVALTVRNQKKKKRKKKKER